jgi:signal transduction histidine kinase
MSVLRMVGWFQPKRGGRSPLAAGLLARLGGVQALVSPTVTDKAERARQGAAIAGLVSAGAALSLAAPIALVLDAPNLAVALPPLGGAALVGTAAFVSATGRLKAVALGAATSTYVAALSAAAWFGGLGSPALWLLAVVPGEAAMRGHKGPALAALAGFAAALALAGLAHGTGARAPMAGGETMIAAGAGLYAALLVWRATKRPASRVETIALPAVAAEAEPAPAALPAPAVETLAQPEDALAGALARANESSAAKTQFLAAVSHELRTPLNAIIGFSDILHQEFFGGFETPRQKEYVGLIRESGEHLLSIVNTLLDVSKIEAGRYELCHEPFAVDDVLKAAGDTVRAEAERKGLRLDVRMTGGIAVEADRRACHQMLLNLLSNAVKFTEDGVVSASASVREGMLELMVCDTGIGIAAPDLARLGRPFTQVSAGLARRYGGTGLGLSLVRGLAELHGGTLTLRSEPNFGTEAVVSIPLDCAHRSDEAPPETENIVALSHARPKANTDAPLDRPHRRSA